MSTGANMGVALTLAVSTVKNVSDVPIQSFRCTALAAVGEGRGLRWVTRKVGHAGLQSLEPGESAEGA